jgi:glutamate-1-semialdehyde 2,1-aminomutase
MTRTFEKTAAAYRRALETIPLASQTFSKAAMSTVEGAAPLFLDRGDGARVWDIDGNAYIDYVLGLLPVVLGYRDPDVDAAIRANSSSPSGYAR